MKPCCNFSIVICFFGKAANCGCRAHGLDLDPSAQLNRSRSVCADLILNAAYSGGVVSVAWSPDGKRLASACFDGTLKVWDVASEHEILTLKGHALLVESVAWSPDGQRIVSGSFSDHPCGADHDEDSPLGFLGGTPRGESWFHLRLIEIVPCPDASGPLPSDLL